MIRVEIVGLGQRGQAAVDRFCHITDAQIVALRDTVPERVEEAKQRMARHNLFKQAPTPIPEEGMGVDADLVYICTDWQSHVPIALQAMQQGRHVAIEVPAATTLNEIQQLVKTSRETGRHCMMLENCIYDFFELATLGMARAGLFGEIVHVEGGYCHPIGEKWTPWRLDINRHQRGDIYPTHGIAPLCRLLDLHHTDRMVQLVTMDTHPFSGPAVYEKHMGMKAPDFQNADQTTTLIRTERGKTMLIEHNVMTPRPYSRLFQIVGTKGYAQKYPEPLLHFETGTLAPAERDELIRQYLPSYIEPLLPMARKLDPRGGMAYFMDWRLIHCLNNNLPLDIDVYDLAEWCCLSELSRRSLENGSMPVSVPDFTQM